MEEQEALCKELKVENWPNYFLNRLHYLYTKGTHCDLILRFASLETLQVHRIVIQACTDYFDGFLKECTNNTVDLEASMTPEAVAVVVGFIYSGKLDLRSEIRQTVYNVAQEWKLSILTRLIDTQFKPSTKQVACATEITLVAPPQEQAAPSLKPEAGQVLKPVQKNEVPPTKRITFSRVAVPKRKAPVIPFTLPSGLEARFHVTQSKAIPTRLEWEKPLCNDLLLSPVGIVLRCMAHDDPMTCPQPLSVHHEDDDDISPSPAKKPLINEQPDLSHMKEFGRQQQIRNELVMEEDDPDDPPEVSSPIVTPPKPILKQMRPEAPETPKRVRFLESDDTTTAARFAEVMAQPTASPSTTRVYAPPATAAIVEQPAMQLPSERKVDVEDLGQGSEMEVRVDPTSSSATSGQLVLSKIPNHSGKATSDSVKRVRYSVLSVDGKDPEPSPDAIPVGNPAKIVSEVLRKYPDLVAGGRKNIKLKVFTNSLPNATPVLLPPESPKTMGPSPKMDSRVCRICGERFHKAIMMTNHMLLKHRVDANTLAGPAKSVHCTQCRFIAADSATMEQHMELAHSRKALTCSVCNVYFKSRLLLSTHRTKKCTPAADNRYRCPYCTLKCDAPTLQEHIRSQHWTTQTDPLSTTSESLASVRSSSEGVSLTRLSSSVECTVDTVDPLKHEESESPDYVADVSQQNYIHGIEESHQEAGDGDGANYVYVGASQESFAGPQVIEEQPEQHSQSDESNCLQIDESQGMDDACEGNHQQEHILYKHPDGTYRSFGGDIAESSKLQVMEHVTDVYPQQHGDEHSQLTYAQPPEPYSEQVNGIRQVYVEQLGNGEQTGVVYTEVEHQTGEVYSENGEAEAQNTVVYTEVDGAPGVYTEGDEEAQAVVDVYSETEQTYPETTDKPPTVAFSDNADSNNTAAVVYSESEATPEVFTSEGETGQVGLVYQVSEGKVKQEEQYVVATSEGSETFDVGHDSNVHLTPNSAEAPQIVSLRNEEAVCADVDGERPRGGDHDYAPFNSVVMVQRSVPAITNVGGRLMLLSHPLQVLLTAPMTIPYSPECGPVDAVNNPEVNISNDAMEVVEEVNDTEDGLKAPAEMNASDQQMECCIDTEAQQPKERKVEPAALVDDWDENNEVESCAVVPPPGSGPSRPEFF